MNAVFLMLAAAAGMVLDVVLGVGLLMRARKPGLAEVTAARRMAVAGLAINALPHHAALALGGARLSFTLRDASLVTAKRFHRSGQYLQQRAGEPNLSNSISAYRATLGGLAGAWR